MNTALVSNTVPTIQPETKENLKDEIQTFILGGELSKKLSPTQKDLCIKTSLAFNLNPLKREVHFIPYNNDIKIVVGYEVYLKRAERTGKLNGWSVDIKGQGNDMKAVVTINRKDWEKPFTHETYYTEARQSSPIWLKMPRFMLKKVAVAQAFRLAFPEEMGGLPYMPEEIGVTIVDHNDKYKMPIADLERAKAKSEITETVEQQHPQSVQPEVESATSAETCEVCGKRTTPAVQAFSNRKFGRTLCMTCQRL